MRMIDQEYMRHPYKGQIRDLIEAVQQHGR